MIKILVIGEKCIDKFIYGDVDRLSPEAPIPVLIPKHTKTNSGMAGNVVENLNYIVDTDEYEVDFIYPKSEITKTRYVENKSNHPFIRIDENDIVERLELSEEIILKIKSADAVIVSDYDKGFLNEIDLYNIGRYSKFSVLDTKKKLDKSTIESFSFIKLNEAEFKRNYTEDGELLKKIIITLGSKGAKYNNKIYPSWAPRETIDVSGAGDTFTASFTYRYLMTQDIDESIEFANQLATRVVSKRGVSTP
jgi:bifunctional ADP-heptose synthase (sugar kinase/adenylyltransferase)